MNKKTTLKLYGVVAILFFGLNIGLVAHAQEKTLRFVPYANLQILDPYFTTSYITRNFGYMVYDTLFARDANGNIHPQMVDHYKESNDGMSWTFFLRKGLKFSDGSSVTAKDAVASLGRWSKRDSIGRAIMDAGGEWSVVDNLTFKLTLTQPFGLVLDGLAKVTSYPAFVMPAKLANKSLDKPLTEAIGSGPYIFKKNEWVHGSKVVFERNPNYVPPKMPASGLAGDKTPKIDRVVWVITPDSNSAVASLKSGEVDLLGKAPPDFIPNLMSDPNITVGALSQQQSYLVLNEAFPPFDSVKARQAVMHAIDQNYVTKAMGYPDKLRMKYCATMFICGSPYATDAGAAQYRKPNIPLAKKLLSESGYSGEKVVVLLPTNVSYIKAATLVAVNAMRKIGLNIETQSMDWSTLTSRRAEKKSSSHGGWGAFSSVASANDLNSPMVNEYIAAGCGNSIPGWPCDKKLDELISKWVAETDPAKQKAYLDKIQIEAYTTLPYLPMGQYSAVFAARKDLKGTDKLWSIPNLWVLDK